MTTVITLPSNACMSLFKDNTISSYRVELPKRLTYEGPHEVGLTGFMYNRTWYNFPVSKYYECEIMQRPSMTGPGPSTARTAAIKPGHYVSEREILEQLNLADTVDYVEFIYSPITRKVNILFKRPNWCVSMDRSMCVRLGWGDDGGPRLICGGVPCIDDTEFVPILEEPPHVLLLDPIDLIYVYSNIASEGHIVGDTEVALLKTIPVKGQHGERVNYEPRIIDWLPLRSQEIQTISVLITDGTGNIIPFESGQSLVRLHIRKRGFLI